MSHWASFLYGLMVGVALCGLWITYITARYAPADLLTAIVAIIERYGRKEPRP